MTSNSDEGAAGPSQAAFPHRSFPLRYYVLIGLAVVALCATFIYSRQLISHVEEVNASFVAPARELKTQAALAHLWTEEATTGDPDITLTKVQETFYLPIQQVELLINDLEAGWWREYEHSEAEILAGLLAGIRKQLIVNRDIALKRVAAREQSQAGSPADKQQDAAFQILLEDLNSFDQSMAAVVSTHYREARAIQAAMIAITLLLGGAVFLVTFRFSRQRARNLTVIAGQNTELQAVNQQLMATEQQLRATNQQLMATEQQLRASNEQLTASERELRAAYAELLANQQTLEESEQRYRTLIGNMAEGVAIHRLEYDTSGNPVDYRILEVNNRYEIILDKQPGEAVGRLATEVYGTERAPYLKDFTEVALGGPPLRFEMYYPPMDKYFSISASSFEPGYFVTIFNDISERKRSEEAIRLNEARLESLLEISQHPASSPEQLFEYGLQKTLMLTRSDCGAIFLCNRQSERLERVSIIGRREECYNSLDDEGLCDFQRSNLLQKVLAQGTPLLVNEPVLSHDANTPGSEVVFKRSMAVPLLVDGRVHAIIALADKESPYDNADYRQTMLLMEAVNRIVDLRRAVDDRFQIEIQMQKLESLGVLAGGIAHDFNNMLTAVLANINLASQPDFPAEGVKERLVEAERATFRAKGLAQQLLTFARGGAPIKKVTLLQDLTRETATFALRGSQVRCVFDFAQDLWPVNIDAGQIGQVINNLVINGSQAMPAGGTIEITADNVSISADAEVPLTPGDYAQVTFKDHGLGITPEHLSKIFDPYFTTKDQGNGLGLAVSHAIIRNHQGYIQVQSRMNEGTAMTVYLPATKASLPLAEEKPASPSLRGGRVLVMDDEIELRDLAKIILEQAGYDTTLAADGQEALKAYRTAQESGQTYDAVILDLTVAGGMGGRETIDRLRALDPDVRAIVSSGYSNDPIMADYTKYGFCGVITKPYTINDMLQELHRVTADERGNMPA